MIQLRFQYFDDCPLWKTLLENLQQALTELEPGLANLEIIKIKDENHARSEKFRGSPTLLINGEDWAGAPEPADAALACRFYPGGVPTADEIRRRLLALKS